MTSSLNTFLEKQKSKAPSWLTAGLIAFLVILIVTWFGWWMWGKLLIQFPAYPVAKNYILHQPRIADELGDITNWDKSPSGFFEYNQEHGEGNLKLHLSGTKGKGILTITLTSELEQSWLIDSAILKKKGQDPIDLDTPKQWEAKAYEALNQRNTEEAQKDCALIREATPQDYRGFYCMAEIAWNQGNKIEFLEIRKQLAALSPEYYVYEKQLGDAYNFLGNYEKAAEHYLKAWSLKPQAQTASDLASAYLDLGNYEKALEFLKKATELNLQSATLAYRYGKYYLAIQEPAKAIEYFDKARHIDPNLADAYFGLAYANMALNENEKAIFFFEQGISRAPTSSLKHRTVLVNLLIAQNYYDEAIYHLIKTSLYHPDDISTFEKLATLYQKQGRYNAAQYVADYIQKLKMQKLNEKNKKNPQPKIETIDHS
jgi:tetratricopeptide (TPR) repeat protein